ncbi:MAG: TIM barrel protein [Sulfitobacter sp.]
MTLKFAANLTSLWPELPYLDRFNAAAEAGFDAIEILFPYEVAAKETQRALLANGQQLVLLNAPPPNYTGGVQGFAAEPDRIDRFQRDIIRAYRYAEMFGASYLHVMSGYAEGETARETFVSNLIWAADRAPEGLTLTVEPLNAKAMPGYYMNDYDLAAEVINAVDLPNVGLQFDSYHAQMIHGNAVAVFDKFAPLIRHIQIGDTPERRAPGTGEVDFAELFTRIAASGYDGWISAEYHPGGATEDTLEWRGLA